MGHHDSKRLHELIPGVRHQLCCIHMSAIAVWELRTRLLFWVMNLLSCAAA